MWYRNVYWSLTFANKNKSKNLGSQITGPVPSMLRSESGEFNVPTLEKAPDECRVKYRDVANEWLNNMVIHVKYSQFLHHNADSLGLDALY